jgi:AraC-like DNA-binding protein
MDCHPEPTLCIGVSGLADLQVGSSWSEVSEGGVLVIPPHVPHSGLGPHCRPGRRPLPDSILLWLEFLSGCVYVHFCVTQDGRHESKGGCYVLDGALYDSLVVLVAELRDRRVHYEQIARSCLLRIMLQVQRGIDEGAAFVASGWELERIIAGGTPVDVASRVERFLRANYNRRLTLREICRCNCASRSLVCLEFKKKTGVSVMDYLMRLRLEVAKRLLLSDLKIREIARLVGFNDAYHFSRRFAQAEKLSPRAWRRLQATG